MHILPLSKAQQRIWLDSQLMPQSPAYNNPLLYRLNGNVNVKLLAEALQHIVDTQPALRSYFAIQNGLPKQILIDKVTAQLDFYDVHSAPQSEQATLIAKIKHENVETAFDLTQLPLFRFTLIRDEQQAFLLILNIHHIVVDGYSATLLIQQISDYYNHCSVPQQSLDAIYSNYLQKPNASTVATEQFWLEQLHDAHFAVDLYAKATHVESAAGLREHFAISAELTKQIKMLARENKTTDFIVLMSAFFVTLAKYANQYDLTIGYAVDTRPQDCKQLFGFFVNNLPLRLQFSPTDHFQTIIKLTTQKRKVIKPHQSEDYFDIIRVYRQSFSTAITQLYTASFIRANFALTGLQLNGTEVTALPIYTGAVKDDICLLYDENGNFEFEIEYRCEKYHADLIQSIKQSFIKTLTLVTQQPTTPLCELYIFAAPSDAASLQEAQRATKQASTDVTNALSQTDETIISKLKHYAQTEPDHIAIRTEIDAISYHVLYEKVAALSAQFAALHLDQNQPLIVFMERTPALLQTLLALQWLGIPYIPLDINTPKTRIATIMAESKATAILTCNTFTLDPYRVIVLKDLNQIATRVEPRAGTLAYIIYTSGSTGQPKGVAVYTNALMHFLHCMQEQFQLKKSDCLLAITTIAFDISALELFLPIWCGATVYIANQKTHKDPFAIKTILDDDSITMLQATPAMWTMLLTAGFPDNTNITALCGGEALSTTLAADLLPKVKQLWNMYGPTEATIWCAIKEIVDGTNINIGHALPQTQFYILDEQQNILPNYIKGELCIAGIQLAQGYYQRDDLTNVQFIHHPILNERLYRTGDIALKLANGEIVLYGRKDNQIKLNGYRIELGEIEAQLSALSAIKQAVVIINNKQLVAHIVMHTPIPADEIEQQLKMVLPEYMLPAQYHFQEALPLSNSGKVDRKLLANQSKSFERVLVPPYTPLEKLLHSLWCKVLQKDAISTTDHFYAAGGHSLLAAQIISELQLQHHLVITMNDFFRYSSIQSAAKFLETNQIATKQINAAKQKYYPLSFAQKRFWFLSQFVKNPSQFNMSGYLHIKGQLDLDRLQKAAQALMQHHVLLRTIITNDQDEPSQTLLNDANMPIQCVHSTLQHAVHALLPTFAHKPFILHNQLLWRALFIEIENNEFILAFACHHMIADGKSIHILLNDLWQAYAKKQSTNTVDISFLDFAQWESEQAIAHQDMDYWRELLKDTSYLRLPYDQCVTPANGNFYWVAKEWHNIQTYCKQICISPSTYLLASFALLLQRITGLNGFCIGIPHAARKQAQTEYLVGCFIDLLPLKISVPDHLAFEDWLLQLQHDAQHYQQQAIPFIKLLEQHDIPRHDALMPLFNVVLNIQPELSATTITDDLTIHLHHLPNDNSKYDLTLNLYFSQDTLSAHCEYDANKFAEATIKDWCHELQNLLQQGLDHPRELLKHHEHEATSVTETKSLTINSETTLTPLQTDMRDYWLQFLNIRQVNLHDNYFSLGGHSLLATKLIAALNNHLGVQIPLETIFIHPIFADFCQAISDILSHSASLQGVQHATQQFIAHHIPLTANQQQLALLYTHQANAAYHLGVSVEWPEPIDVATLQKNISALFAQHQIYQWQLNSDLTSANLHPDPHVHIQVMHCHNALEKNDLMQTFLNQTFDLLTAPLARFAIVIENDKQHLVIVLHHLISDEWSLELLVHALLNEDDQSAATVTNCLQFVEPVDKQVHLQYWHDYLHDRSPTLLPSTKQMTEPLHIAKRRHDELEPALVHECLHLAEQHGVSLYVVLLAFYFVFLKYFTNEKALYIATAYDRRNTLARQGLHGYLVNLMPIVLDFESITDLSDLISYLNQDRNHSLQHADVDFATLLANGDTYAPHIIFNYQHHFELMKNDKSVAWQELHATNAKFPMVFNLRITDENKIACVIEYNDDLYHAEYIDNCYRAFANLIKYLPENKSKPIADWRLTAEATIDNRSIKAPVALRLLQKLEQIAHTHAHQLALSFNGKTYSYRELWQSAEQVARGILSINRNVRGETIAVVMSNSDDFVLTILAILMLDASFLPIDTSLPIARQQQMIADANAVMVVTHQSEFHPEYVSFTDLFSCSVQEAGMTENGAGMTSTTNAIAYIIYTSGTTGTPKGVPISQQQLYQFITALADKLSITHEDHILQFASISFDASIWEIFLALATGASLFVPNQRERLAGANLQHFINQNNITHTILTPSVIKTLDPTRMTTLRSLVSGGEACTSDLVKTFADKMAFYNAYGPTEATVCTNIHRFQKTDKATNIGNALGENILTIISESKQALPTGAIGELIVGGENITLGYLNRAALNKEKFIHYEHERYYRTGDYVRKLTDNDYEYIGRTDQQIKLRGLRIELAEIAAAIKQCGVQDAICVVKDNVLVSYVTHNENIDAPFLLRELRNILPPYMLPQHIIQIATIPLNVSGKIDYRKLPDIISNQNEHVSPRNDIERTLHEIWQRYVTLNQLSIQQNFFELGGNSLQAMQIVAAIEAHFKIELTLPEFYSEATIANQAILISTKQQTNVVSFPSLNDLTMEELELLHQELSQL